MKPIDGDALAERVMYKFIYDPDYTLEDAIYDIQDAEELEAAEYWGQLAFKVRELLEAQDIVKVVRCKECKWWKSNFTWNCKEVKVCVKEPYEPVRKENYFCADGERRERWT